MPDTPEEIRSSPRKLWLAFRATFHDRILWYLQSTLIILALIVMASWKKSTQDPNILLAESTKALESLNHPAIPASENAAVVYKKAWTSIAAWPGVPGTNPLKNNIDSDQMAADPNTETFMANNQAVFTLLEQAGLLKDCDFGLDFRLGFNVPIPHLHSMRELGRLLSLKAYWAAYKSNHAEAVAALQAQRDLFRHMSREKILISSLLAESIANMVPATMQRIMLRCPPKTISDVRAYRKILEQLEPREELKTRLLETMNVEMKVGIFHMDLIAVKGLSTLGMGPPSNEPRIPVLEQAMTGNDRETIVKVYGWLNDSIKAGKTSGLDKDILGKIREYSEGPSVLTHMLVPIIERAPQKLYFRWNRYETARTGLAWLEYRLTHGHDPAMLEALAPEILKDAPVDYQNEALHLRMDEEGLTTTRVYNSLGPSKPEGYPAVIRIYSLGFNGKDDGGQNHEMESIGTKAWEKDDIFFAILPAENTKP